MQITNTQKNQAEMPVIMLVYGDGGVGKSSFAATAPSPLFADCENGTKYFGARGINVDVALIRNWAEMEDFYNAVEKSDKYKTVVIDPIGELMDKLKLYMLLKNDSKLVQRDGSPSMAGWGWLKQTMRNYLKVLRDSGKNVLLVAHVEEKDDDGRIIKRPKIETKISEEIVNMVDIVAYMRVVTSEDGQSSKRVLLVDSESDKYVAKDRTGKLGKIVKPDFAEIIKTVNGKAEKSGKVKVKASQKKVAKKKVKQLEKTDLLNPFDDAPEIDYSSIMKLLSVDKESKILGACAGLGVNINELPDTQEGVNALAVAIKRVLIIKKKQYGKTKSRVIWR